MLAEAGIDKKLSDRAQKIAAGKGGWKGGWKMRFWRKMAASPEGDAACIYLY